ncbi:hypothetical protein OG700_10450 [Streptomyces sp. NBC_01508]
MRLLPWTGEGGKPAYLSTDDKGSYLSRLADDIEVVQLGMAEDLLDDVQKTVAKEKPSVTELRSIITHLSLALRNSLRVAHSRGDRLPLSEDEDEELTVETDAVIERRVVR